MKHYLQEIRKNTEGMTGAEKAEYVITYYWYHILGICAFFGLIIFLIVHFAFASPKPEFSCAIVGQRIDYQRDADLEKDFADTEGLSEKLVDFDSDYNFSYTGKEEDKEKEGIGESSFEKFFLKWSNGELDAVVLTEDFLKYCIESDGEFYSEKELNVSGLEVRKIDGVPAIPVKGTRLDKYLNSNEELFLVFPKAGKHLDADQKLIDFCSREDGE